MDVTLPDGTVLQGVPDGTTKAQIAQKLEASGRSVPKEWLQPPPAPRTGLQTALNVEREATGAVVEPALQMASGALATIPAAAAMVGAEVVPGANPEAVAGKVLKTLTYEPKTEAGKAVFGALAEPFRIWSDVSERAGRWAQDQGASPAVAAGVQTAVNAIPAIMAKGLGLAESGELSAAEAQKVAQAAAGRAGLDWNSLSGNVQNQLTRIAKASHEQSLDPAATAREARMAQHPVPITPTKAQAERNPVDLKLEKQASQTDSGAAIRQRYLEQNRQLQQNLDVLRGRTGARENTPEAAGTVVQDAARAKLKEQQQEVGRLYRKAKAAGEMKTKVPVKPLVDLLNNHLDPSSIDYATNLLRRKGVLEGSEAEGFKGTGNLSLAELERLRSRAATIARTDHSTKGHDAGDLVKAIDQTMDQVNAGSSTAPGSRATSLYAQARAARKALGNEFERQQSVEKLVSSKAGKSDRAVALEDTWNKAVKGGSIQDLRNVLKTLNQGSKATRELGRRGIKELAGQTVDYIKSEATKSIAPMETGEPTFNANGFIKAVTKDIGRPKLEALLGKTATDELFKLVDTSKDLLTEPPSREVGSSTFSNLLRWADKHASKLSGVSHAVNVAKGAVKLVQKAQEEGGAGSFARQQLQTPMQSAAVPQTSLLDVLSRGQKAALPLAVGLGVDRQ